MVVVQTNVEYREIYVGYADVPVYKIKYYPQDKKCQDEWNKNLTLVRNKYGDVNDIIVIVYPYSTDYTIKARCSS